MCYNKRITKWLPMRLATTFWVTLYLWPWSNTLQDLQLILLKFTTGTFFYSIQFVSLYIKINYNICLKWNQWRILDCALEGARIFLMPVCEPNLAWLAAFHLIWWDVPDQILTYNFFLLSWAESQLPKETKRSSWKFWWTDFECF